MKFNTGAGLVLLTVALLACDSSSEVVAAGDCERSPRADASLDGCPYVFRDYCFDSAEKACACAGCGVDRCLVVSSVPSR